MDSVVKEVMEQKQPEEDKFLKLESRFLRNDDSHFILKSRETSYFKDDPKNAVLKGFPLAAKEKYQEDNYDLYHSIIKTKVDRLFNRAKEAFEKEDYTKCLSILSKSFYFEADNADYYSLAGDCYWKLNDHKAAILIYKKVCTLNSELKEDFGLKISNTHTKEADNHFDDGNYLDALDNYVRASEINPLDQRNCEQSINCLIALNRHQDCLTFINQRLEKELDNNTRLLLSRARLHLAFNKPTLCYYDIKEALILNPDCVDTIRFREERRQVADGLKEEAENLDLSGNIDQAIFKISKAIATFPSVAEYYLLRGSMQRRNSTFNAAVDDLSKAMDTVNYESKNETFKVAQKQLLLTFNDFAVYCFQKEYYEEAIVLLEKAIQAEKHNKFLYINRGDCFLKLCHLHFALLDYQQAEELDPFEKSISLRLSTVYNELGKLEYKDKKYYKAENYLSLAIAHDPKVVNSYTMRAKSRYMMDMITETQVDVISVLYLDPSNRKISSLFSRLFSGKTVDQVTRGDLGQAVVMALRTELEEMGYGLERKASFSPKQPLPGVTANQITTQLKKCLEDQDFHHSIIDERKTMDEIVEVAIQYKQDLRSTGPRVSSNTKLEPTVVKPN